MNKNRINISANYLGQGWSAFMAIAFLPAYINHLGVEAYGVIGLFVALQAILMILDLAIGATLNREMARSSTSSEKKADIRNLLFSLEVICFALGTIGLTVVWLASPYMTRDWLNSGSLEPHQISNAIVFMWLVACLRLFEGMYRGILFGAGEQVWYNTIYSLIATLRYAGTLGVLMWISATLQAFFIWQLIVSLLSVCLLKWRVKCRLPNTGSPEYFSLIFLAKIKNFATGMIGIGIATILLLQLDKVVLSHLVSLKNLGYYTLASTAANTMFMVVVPITQALYPSLVVLTSEENQESLITLFRKITQAVAIMVATATMLLAFFPGGIIFAWSGNQELVSEAAPLLAILVVGSYFNCLSYLPFQLQTAFGQTQQLLKIYILSVIIFCPLLYTCAFFYGVYGAAWSWLIINLINLILVAAFTHKVLLITQRWSWYIADVLVPSATALSIMLLARQFQPLDYSQRLHWLLFIILTGLLSMIFSIGFSPMIRQSVLAMFKKTT